MHNNQDDPEPRYDVYLELDSTFNFRCNAKLKEDFSNLCKKSQTSPSASIKKYMLSCLLRGSVY